MCGGDDREELVPAAPEYTMSPEERELLTLQSEMMRTSMPGIRSYIEDILPMEEQRTKDKMAFTDPILRGGRLPGVYANIGQPLGTEYGGYGKPLGAEYESEMFERASGRTKGELNRLGLLDSGVTAELLNKTNTAIAMDSATRNREELKQLINLAMGVPMTALPAAQTASGQAAGVIPGIANAQRSYELSARPQYAPGGGGSDGSGIGSALGMGLGALLAMPTGGTSLMAGAAIGGGIGKGIGGMFNF